MKGLFANQVRKELRQHRFSLVAWGLVLAADFAHGAAVTRRVFDAEGGYRWGGGPLSLFVLVLFALAAVLPLAMGLADSPANSRGFIHTRPVARRVVWGAKLVVLGLAVVVPAAAASVATVLAHGGGLGLAFRAGLDRAAFLVPALVFLLCWSGLCGGAVRFVRLTLAAAAVVSGVLLLVIGIQHGFGGGERLELALEEPGGMLIRWLLALAVSAVVAAVAMAREARGPRWRGRPMAVAVLVAVVGAAAFSLPGLNLLRPDGSLPAGIAEAVGAVEVTPDPYSLKTWRGDVSGDRRWFAQSEVEVSGVPSGLAVDPVVRSAVLRAGDGSAWRFDRPARDDRWRGEVRVSSRILEAVADTIGGEVTLYQGHNASGFQASHPVLADWSAASGLDTSAGVPLDLEFEFESGCVAVRELARLPLRDGASVRTEAGTITLMRPPLEPWESPNFALRMRRAQLWLTRDEVLRSRDSWQLGRRFLCVLARPGGDEALLCDFTGGFTSRGTFTGMPEAILIFSHEPGDFAEKFDEPAYDGIELRVFRLDWLGEHRSVASLAGVRLDHREVKMSDAGSRSLDMPAYWRAFERLGPVGERPTRADVEETLRIIGRRQGSFDAAEPGVRRLAAIGRRDLGLLLEAAGRPAAGYSSRVLVRAIESVVTEDDRAAVIAALGDAPELAAVVVGRGWERDARDELLALARERRELPADALVGIVLLEDPESHPWLLDHFAHVPNPWAFDLLWEVPALREGLERIVTERWESRRRFIPDDNLVDRPDLQLALRIGREDALAIALEAAAGNEQYGAVEALRPVLLLPQRHDAAAKSLAGATRDDFVFDPRCRVFLPRERGGDAGAASPDRS